MKALHSVRRLPNCNSLEEATRRLMEELKDGRDVYCQFHRVARNTGFPVHRHLTANEWTILWNAKFNLVTRNRFENHVRAIDSSNEVTVVYVPIGVCHTVRSKDTELRYAVVKDGPDDFHLC